MSPSPVSCKSVFTTGADDAVLTFSARQSEDRLTRGALTVDVSFSISEFVFLKTPEITELFVLTTALCDIFRKHTEADNDNERH